jgi:zinc transport system substrate-binding protein
MIQGLYMPRVGRTGRIVLFFLMGMFISLSSYCNAADSQTLIHAPADQNKQLYIVSSIKPIHLLVKEIVGKHANAFLLIPENVNTHDYSLRPSDLKKLAHADLIIRISGNLEVFLNKLLSQKKVISLANTPQLSWLPIRHSHGVSDTDIHQHHHEEREEQTEHRLNHDPHIWLDVANTIKMVAYISQQISAIDPSHQSLYIQNSQQLIDRIQKADQLTKQLLKDHQQTPYLVFHDGWQYLEHDYKLKKPYVISFQEDLPPGIKTILSLRQQITEQDIRCLIASPFNNKRIIKTLIEDLTVKVIWLSASGAGIPINNYAELMKYNASQLSLCFQDH